MKGKKRYIILLVLIGAFLGFLYCTKDKRKEQIKRQDEKIKEDNKLREKKAIKLTSVTSFDKEKYGNYDSSLNNLITFKKGKVYYVLDNKGKELYYGSIQPELVSNEKGTQAYYRVGNLLYDDKGNQLYDKLEDDMHIDIIIGKDLIINYGDNKFQIINYESKDIKNIDFFVGNYNGIYVYVKNGKYYTYNNGEKEFDSMIERNRNEYIYLKSKTENVYLNKEKGIITEEEYNKIKINNKFYIDYTNCIQVKSYSDNKSIVDECFYEYDKINDNFYAFISEKDEVYLFRDGKIEKEKDFNRGYIGDNTYYASKGNKENNYYIFYENGETKEVECASNVSHAGNNVYSCNDIVESYFIENNKIRDDKYDSILCYQGKNYCVVEKNNKKGLYYMGEKIIEPNYKEIMIEENYVILDLDNKYNFYYIDKDRSPLKKEDLNPKIEEEKYEIDTDKIVDKYKLDKDLVKENKELFTKYAYIVENNKNIADYKNYLYDYFKVVIDEKKYLNEDLFFDSLKSLQINIKDNLLNSDAAGEYFNIDNVVDIKKDYIKSEPVFYHELMHYIDYCLNDNQSNYILKNKDKIITKEEYKKLSISDKRNVDVNLNIASKPYFMVEAGAEIYSARYFNNSYTVSYVDATNIYYIFEYIFGEDTMKSIFFGKENLYTYLKNSISEDKYNKFLEATERITRIGSSKEKDDYVVAFDTLIDIYTNLKGKEWYNDNEFCFLLYNFSHLNFNSLVTSKNYNTYEKIQVYYEKEHERLGREIAKLFNETYVSNPTIIYENGSIILTEFYNLASLKDSKIVKFKYNANDKTIKEISRNDI